MDRRVNEISNPVWVSDMCMCTHVHLCVVWFTCERRWWFG